MLLLLWGHLSSLNETRSAIAKNADAKKVIFTLIPAHNNYGDQAIVYAQNQFFKHYFPEYQQYWFYASDNAQQFGRQVQ